MSFILWQGFPGGSAGKESACNVGDLDSIPGLLRSPGEGKGCPLQYSGLESSSMGSQRVGEDWVTVAFSGHPPFCLRNPVDRRAWQATVHRVAESQTHD